MKIVLIGPGFTPIPPIGWGAVEILVWNLKLSYEQLGHEVLIINTQSPIEIITKINSFRPDFVYVQYDDFVELCPYIQYPNAITNHFGYFEQPNKWGDYGRRIIDPIRRIRPNVFCLSSGIKNFYINEFGFSKEQLYITPNGVDLNIFKYNKDAKYFDRSLYLAKIDYRKRQYMFQDIKNLYFAGNISDNRFDNSKNYLGEWSKNTLFDNLTDYGNLVLLSDGEAHPLVCMEAFAAGLGVVVSQWAAANLDTDKDFIDIIPESKINDIPFVENVINKNREYSIGNRQEIRNYAKIFEWKNIISKYHIPSIEKVIKNHG